MTIFLFSACFSVVFFCFLAFLVGVVAGCEPVHALGDVSHDLVAVSLEALVFRYCAGFFQEGVGAGVSEEFGEFFYFIEVPCFVAYHALGYVGLRSAHFCGYRLLREVFPLCDGFDAFSDEFGGVADGFKLILPYHANYFTIFE